MSYPLTADGGPDDLPRTFRREREAREREAREREAAERAQAEREALPMGPAPQPHPSIAAAPSPAVAKDAIYAAPDPNYIAAGEPTMPASVQRFDVPFLHLVAFFLKAVIAAIPALILLAALLWGGGQLLKMFFPWLVKAQILIHFPN